MLVIDEIHEMLQGTFREQRIFLSALRFLVNDLRIPLVCLGTNEAKQALMTDQQLADRFGAFDLPAWTDDAAFAQLVKSFGALLPLQKRSELWEPKNAQTGFEFDRRSHGSSLSPAGKRCYARDQDGYRVYSDGNLN